MSELVPFVPYSEINGANPHGVTLNGTCHNNVDQIEAPRLPKRLIEFSAQELQAMNFPPIKFVVPGFLTEGLNLLVGAPKLGKSWLALAECVGVAGGRYVLGDILCQQGAVLYCALEDNPRRIKDRMSKIMQPNDDWPEALDFSCECPQLDKGGVDYIRNWIDSADNPRLVVIDTLAKVRGSRGTNQTNYEADYSTLGEIQALALEKSVAIVLVHHTRKMEASDPLDTVSGTTGITGVADTILILSRGSDGVTLYVRGRDIEEKEVALNFNKDCCQWIIRGDAGDVYRSSERSKILNVLIEAKNSYTPKDIAIGTGMDRNAIDQLLFSMNKDGEVQKVGRGLYIHPQRSDLLPPDKNDKKIRKGE